MSKFFYTTILFCTGLIICSDVAAQSFEKGSKNLDIGIGFAGFESTAELSFDFLGEPITLEHEDDATSFLIPFAFEYGIGEKVGLGVELTLAYYFIDSTGTTESVKSVDFEFFVNYHLLNSDKNDLMLGLMVGPSSVNWKFEDGNNMIGTGTKFGIYVKDRIFFGDQFGITLQAGYLTYSYNKIDTSNSNAVLERIDWNLKGWNIGTGLAMKF